jgi:hypothetical protein
MADVEQMRGRGAQRRAMSLCRIATGLRSVYARSVAIIIKTTFENIVVSLILHLQNQSETISDSDVKIS